MSLLSVDGLRTRYVTQGRVINAVDGVSLDVGPGETVGLVGESGCGKSTLGKTILRLLDPVQGSIRFRGNELSDLGQHALLPFRQRMQIALAVRLAQVQVSFGIAAGDRLVHRQRLRAVSSCKTA